MSVFQEGKVSMEPRSFDHGDVIVETDTVRWPECEFQWSHDLSIMETSMFKSFSLSFSVSVSMEPRSFDHGDWSMPFNSFLLV